MKRYCFICKEVQEFRLISTMTITLNRNKTFQYCLQCKNVVFAEASEEVKVDKKEKKEFFGKVSPVGAY